MSHSPWGHKESDMTEQLTLHLTSDGYGGNTYSSPLCMETTKGKKKRCFKRRSYFSLKAEFKERIEMDYVSGPSYETMRRASALETNA